MSLFYNKVPAHGAFFISKPFCLFSNYVASWKNVPIFAPESPELDDKRSLALIAHE